MPIYGSYEYKEEGSGTGLNRKQGLVETDSKVVISLTCFDRVQSLHLKISVVLIFALVGREFFDKILCTTPVITCPVKSTILERGDAKLLH